MLGEDSSTSFNNLVGYLPEERGLYRKMRVLELLHFFATLKGNRDGKVDARFWFEELGLSEWGNEKVETLSKGMSQKLQFIASIIARPKLLIIDEPFVRLIKRTVLDLRKQGATILFSTLAHYRLVVGIPIFSSPDVWRTVYRNWCGGQRYMRSAKCNDAGDATGSGSDVCMAKRSS